MTSRTASLRLQLIDAVSGPSAKVASTLRNLDGTLGRLGKSGSPEIRRLVKQLEYLKSKSGALDNLAGSKRGLKDLANALEEARNRVKGLEKALASSASPTKKMQQDLDRARTAVKNAALAFAQQTQAVTSAERALRSYSVNSGRNVATAQQKIRSEVAKTLVELRKVEKEQVKPKPRPGGRNPQSGRSLEHNAIVAGTGYVVGDQGRRAIGQAFFNAIDFNEVAAYQSALGGFNPDERGKLNRQAEKIGGDTRFSNVDVVKAQTMILQGGIRDVKQIMDLTEKITDYSLAMGVTLEEGAETVRGSALSKRIDLSDVNAISTFVDNLVWMAKNGGMSDEDVRQYMKYGGGPTKGVNLPDNYAAAIGMVLRRSGLRGDEAGVFARTMSSKLVAPTKKGRDSLAAMGIDYNDYVSMPDAMNAEGVEIMMKNNFGKRITPEMREAIAQLMNEGEFTDPETGETRSVASDSGEFTTQMSDILNSLFAGKGGKVAAKDAQALSKALSDYHKYSVESVDVVGLFNAIMSSNPTQGNLNAYFTDRQGGRASLIAQQWPLFQKLLELMNNTPEGVANDIGTKANAELYGDWTKLTGTVETVLTRIGQDFEDVTRPIINATNSILDGFLGLDKGSRQLLAAFGMAAAAFAAYAAVRSGAGLLGGLFGGGGAGSGAAAGAAGAAGGAAAAASKGGGFFKKLLRGAGIAGAALTTNELLGAADPKGNLWGLTDGIDKWVEENFGFNPSRVTIGGGGGAGAAGGSTANKAKVAGISSQLDQMTSEWPMAAQRALKSYGNALAQGGAQAETEAQAIGQRVEQALTVEGKPTVNTADIQRALSLARQLAAALRAPAGGGYSSPTNTNKFGGPRARGGPVKRGVTYLVGERGPEPFTAPASGYITSNKDWQEASSSGPTIHAPINIDLTLQVNGSSAADLQKLAEDAAATVVGRLTSVLERQLGRGPQVAFSGAKTYGDS
ncbi:phage tail tape measure protein [Shinella sp. JR1-6]|uniref:phage tail tape measure protein n=1 Tax=Shinella sp. JR1-6 TaxID=2527671 RepID=UPI00102D50E2|nr:phage tail tape measure protein [Shinella sp. JR1-6]TAA54643.1 phage tail tape measure protein [Shinella sp. JR1-6]